MSENFVVLYSGDKIFPISQFDTVSSREWNNMIKTPLCYSGKGVTIEYLVNDEYSYNLVPKDNIYKVRIKTLELNLIGTTEDTTEIIVEFYVKNTFWQRIINYFKKDKI